jgi:predicted PurR-regulated permease PerM
MLSIFRQVSVSVVLSTLATAGAQTAVALVGYLIAGIPLLPLVLFATFVCAFVPAIARPGIAISTGVIDRALGSGRHGIFLIVWGLVAWD